MESPDQTSRGFPSRFGQSGIPACVIVDGQSIVTKTVVPRPPPQLILADLSLFSFDPFPSRCRPIHVLAPLRHNFPRMAAGGECANPAWPYGSPFFRQSVLSACLSKCQLAFSSRRTVQSLFPGGNLLSPSRRGRTRPSRRRKGAVCLRIVPWSLISGSIGSPEPPNLRVQCR